MAFSAGFLRCPKCFAVREFMVDVMAAPGQFPDAYCVACEYCYLEGSIPDAVRIQALEALRADQLEHASTEAVRRFRPGRDG